MKKRFVIVIIMICFTLTGCFDDSNYVDSKTNNKTDSNTQVETNIISENENDIEEKNDKDQKTYDIEESLTNIAKTYYDNEARGNSTYFKKRVKVTAIITSINVDKSVLFNTGVTIHLKESGAKYEMLCQNEDGIKGINKYSRNDTITVIGQMNTMVGNSLWMEKCEIVED